MLYRVEAIEERTVVFQPCFIEADSPEEAEQKAIDTPRDDSDIRYLQVDNSHYHVFPA